MRPIVPLQASMASLSSVLPEDACPTMAKLRMFAEGCVAITLRMRRKWPMCKFHERKVAIAGNVQRSALSVSPFAYSPIADAPSRAPRTPFAQLSLDSAADESASLVAFNALKQQRVVIRKLMTNRSYYCETNRLRIKALCCSRTADAPAVFATSVRGNTTCLLRRRTWKLANNGVGKLVHELLVDFGLAFPPPFRLM